MAKNTSVGRVVVYPASGGLETISVPGTQTVGRLVSGSNFIVDINGAKKKHPGISREHDRTTIVTPGFLTGNTRGLFDHWRLSGSAKAQRTILISDGSILADNGNGLYVDVTGAFTILPTDNVSMETFFGLLVMGFENNPSSTPLTFNHTTVAALGGTPPNAKYLRTWRNRLWAAGMPTAPDRLQASVTDNPSDWTIVGGAESINIDQGDQDPIGITSLFPPLFGRMVVGKKRSLYEVTPSGSTFAISNLITGIGSISHNATIMGDNDIFFVSERGIHSLLMTDKFGELETSFLTYPIQDYFQDNIDFRRAENMRAIYAPEINSYLLAATTRGHSRNDIVLGYNFVLKEWFKMDENVSAMCKYVDPLDGLKTKILVANDNGNVGIFDTSKTGRTVTWFGEQRTTQFTTGLIYPMSVVNEVNFSKISCYFKPQTAGSVFTVSYLVDGIFVADLTFPMDPIAGGIIGSAINGVDLIGGQGRVKSVTRTLRGAGHSIELVFTHTPTTDVEDFELFGFVIEYEYAGESEEIKTH